MRREARGRCKPCTDEDRGSGATAADHETLHFAFQLRHRSVEGLAPRIDDNGPPWVHPIDVTADGFAHPPPDAISHDGFADRPRDGEADLGTVRPRFADKEGCKERTCKLGSLVINSSEVSGAQQTNTFRKTGDGRLPLGADRELVTAARPAARQHGPPVLGLHTGAEAMRLCAVTIIRLKGAFRHCCPSL